MPDHLDFRFMDAKVYCLRFNIITSSLKSSFSLRYQSMTVITLPHLICSFVMWCLYFIKVIIPRFRFEINFFFKDLAFNWFLCHKLDNHATRHPLVLLFEYASGTKQSSLLITIEFCSSVWNFEYAFCSPVLVEQYCKYYVWVSTLFIQKVSVFGKWWKLAFIWSN